ncbi:MAG: Abortive infection protein AbiEii [Lachnospiraceae bacterium]|uniref:Abortive infection protein AbiEii n=1 Tax=Roseburia hominis TaxID=301301 RepID=UPI001F17F272|nr:Abortive infection protein AbiEii [Roseburia hominis]MDD6169504.1 Abortive infection protein AbiEii [Lachnospiraceae bacterium]MDY4840558.1 Abortive infection protein AbiEii [Lachnospiraceae bacterium]
MTNAISVKDRLKKQAIEDGKTMQDKLLTFGIERTIYRLSVSPYAERFTLKGGIFLYALYHRG